MTGKTILPGEHTGAFATFETRFLKKNNKSSIL